MKARIWMAGSMLFVFAVAGGAVQAQDHGPDRDHQDQDHHDQNHNDQGHSRFDDHDRQVSRDWYHQHHDHPPIGLRDRDRLPPEYESRLHEGYVLDRTMRGRIHPIPADYDRQLPPAPHGYRYVFIGGHAVLIDDGYRVHDVIHFELNF